MEAIPEATGEPVLVQAGDFATFLDGFPATGTLTKGSISTGTFTRAFLDVALVFGGLIRV